MPSSTIFLGLLSLFMAAVDSQPSPSDTPPAPAESVPPFVPPTPPHPSSIAVSVILAVSVVAMVSLMAYDYNTKVRVDVERRKQRKAREDDEHKRTLGTKLPGTIH